jgi:hypothetical protein
MSIEISESRIQAVMFGGEYGLGYCLACGAEHYECEPDARNYTCDDCGLEQVFGLEELIMMGRITITD